jgi:hypothetical protein
MVFKKYIYFWENCEINEYVRDAELKSRQKTQPKEFFPSPKFWKNELSNLTELSSGEELDKNHANRIQWGRFLVTEPIFKWLRELDQNLFQGQFSIISNFQPNFFADTTPLKLIIPLCLILWQWQNNPVFHCYKSIKMNF